MTAQYTKLNFVEHVRVEVWRRFLDQHPVPGVPDGDLTYQQVANALAAAVAGGTIAVETHARLQAAVDLSRGRNAHLLTEVLNDANVPEEHRPKELGPQEFVLVLSLSGDARVQRALVDATVLARERGTYSRYRDFVGAECRSVQLDEATVKSLEVAIASVCSDRDLGGHVEVREVSGSSGALILEIIHSKRFRADVRADGTVRRPIRYRPVVGDIVQYTAAHGLLRVSASPASLVAVYRELIGRCLFGDDDFFPDVGPYSLEVLKRGQVALDDHSLSGVHRVRVQRLEWARDDARFTIDADDCFATIGDVVTELTDAKIEKAKLTFLLAKHRSPVSVTVTPPHQAPVRESARRVIETYFERVGIHCVEEDRDASLWNLHDVVGSLADWRAVFGATTDELVAQGVLRPAVRTRVPHPAHPGRGPILRVVRLEDGFWGASDEDDVEGCTLNTTAVEGLELRSDSFTRLLANRLGTVGDPVELMPGLVDLGRVEMGSDSIRLWFATQRPGAAAAALLKGEPNAVVLAPSSDSTRTGRIVSCPPLPRWEEVRFDVVRSLNLMGRVPAVFFAKADTELIVDRNRGAIWYRGCRVEGISPDTQAFRYVEMLAASKGQELSTIEISSKLTNAFHGDSTDAARTAKGEAVKKMRVATKPLGSWTSPFVTRKGFVRCVVPAEVYPPIEL